jgi:hypothetical protein
VPKPSSWLPATSCSERRHKSRTSTLDLRTGMRGASQQSPSHLQKTIPRATQLMHPRNAGTVRNAAHVLHRANRLEELESGLATTVRCCEKLHLIGRDSDSSIKLGRRLCSVALDARNTISRLRPAAQREIGIVQISFRCLPSDRRAESMIRLHCPERNNGKFQPPPPNECEVEPGIPVES